MAELERTYTIPLRREVMKNPKYKRAKKAVAAVRGFIVRHSHSSDVRIGKHLNLKLWEHGMRNVPHSVKVNMTKDSKGSVLVELFGAPKEEVKEEKKAGKSAVKEAEVKKGTVAAATTTAKKEKEKTAIETKHEKAAAETKKEPVQEKSAVETKKETAAEKPNQAPEKKAEAKG